MIKSWYIGYSADLKWRLKRHQEGDEARTTSRKKGWELIYYESYKNEKDAKGRERFLKSGPGRSFLKKTISELFGNTFLKSTEIHVESPNISS